ncbi:50S ribosomal protein L23 [Morus notabilis]|uniref:Large ribosomal subunit protein uL23m n=1 Tax=Morus notabilis TaxID=981085 RepID=W9R604_9ROSA|nr:uncharacterized protein LOC21400209 [Morus notabilis]XP_024019887.1 uncharacterized protein LOC21400209 [Morus notabilis]XP_024019888.1 uncharacterized protein LOC21400209 [Morus notabilis]EXB55292.1 50S ribosomal protein L23 [Morus notabilis]
MKSVVHFPDLPFEFMMPASSNNARDIALKTIPSASKTEIKRVLQTVYGFEVEKVRTLNMQGKKKYRGRVLVAKPNYKKAYVTLKESSTISPTRFSVNSMGDESKSMKKQ